MLTFFKRFQLIKERLGPLCLGLDPSVELFKHWELPFSIDGLKQFTHIVFKASANIIGLIKPQFAFYEQFGPEGMQVLKETIEQAHSHQMLVVADCKRCDISSSLIAYVQAILGKKSVYQADAMTLVPYMGIDAYKEAFNYADTEASQIFIVAQSSNIEGVELQNARINNDQTVTELILNTIQAYNHQCRSKDTIGPIGSVIGATIRAGDNPLNINSLSNQLVLSPGMGAQGACWQDIQQKFRSLSKNTIPTCSRSILQAGPEIKKIQQAIINIKEEIAN